MIAILMSTYNGDKYLKEQLDSILGQTFTDWQLYIRDDGSTDCTVDIINEYVKRYPQSIVSINEGNNIGCGYSFMHLLETVESDYYMFCDQDDVWKNDKIEKTYNKMQEMETAYGKDTPIGVFADLCVVDQDLRIKHDSFWKSNRRNPEDAKHFYRAIVNRQAPLGCTMMMNNAVKRVVFPITDFVQKNGQHDNWVMFILSVKGKIDYVSEPLMYYRQHEKNVSGYEAMTLSHFKVLKAVVTSPQRVCKQVFDTYSHLKQLPIKVSFPIFLYYWILKWIKF